MKSARRASLLPAELPWLYAVIPLPAAYLICRDLLEKPLPLLLRALAKCYLPFVVYGAAFHVVYAWVMPWLLQRVRTRAARMALHVAAVFVVTLPMAGLLLPILQRFFAMDMDATTFIVVSLIFACVCLFPALAVQAWRTRAHDAEHRALLLREAALEAQLRALRARTNPHFLFNSLNTVASLIPEDPVLAERTLERLSDLFRYALESTDARTVRLERELAMVADYLALQSARFGDRLTTHLAFDEDLADIEVPPLLLQPLIENAILHGTARRGGGRVEVAVRREHDRLIIEIRDDGPGPGRSPHVGARTSIASVAERLHLHYAERGRLVLTPEPGGGCLAQLRLPIERSM